MRSLGRFLQVNTIKINSNYNIMSNYKINEYGEIIREDYFFRQVHGTGTQILPFERKVWKILLIALMAVIIFASDKEKMSFLFCKVRQFLSAQY